MDTLLLDSATVSDLAPIDKIVEAVEDAFVAYQRGSVQMPPKSYIDIDAYNGDFRSMPAYIATDQWDAAGIKWVNVHPDNPEQHDLPTVMATIIYSDPETGFPLAIMDGTTVTRLRTGAAAAVATDHLAVDDAKSLGLIGAGDQAKSQLRAIAQIRDIETIIVHDKRESAINDFIEEFQSSFSISPGTISEAARCDILSTITPVTSPIVTRESVGDHTHINAIGADAAGKNELDPKLLKEGTVVIDDFEQCVHSGEINVPWAAGIIDDSDIAAELGEVVTRDKPGRTSEDGITIFDSTGLAIQDVAAAHVIYQHALETPIKNRINLVETE